MGYEAVCSKVGAKYDGPDQKPWRMGIGLLTSRAGVAEGSPTEAGGGSSDAPAVRQRGAADSWMESDKKISFHSNANA